MTLALSLRGLCWSRLGILPVIEPHRRVVKLDISLLCYALLICHIELINPPISSKMPRENYTKKVVPKATRSGEKKWVNTYKIYTKLSHHTSLH